MRLLVLALVTVAGAAEAHPDMSPIRHAVRAQLPAVRTCYLTALAKDPKLEGTVHAKFTIAMRTGKVTASTASGMPAIDDCVARAMTKAQFPKYPRGGSMVVTYPFAFKPR